MISILNWKPEKAPIPEKTAQIFKVLIDKFDKKIWSELCDLNADFSKYGWMMIPQDLLAICANPSYASALVKGLKVINQFYPVATIGNSILLRELLYLNPANAYQTALSVRALYKDKDFSEEQINKFGKKYPKDFIDIANKLVEIHSFIRRTCETTDDLGSFVNKLHSDVSRAAKSFECKKELEVPKVSELSVFAPTQNKEEKQESSVELTKHLR
ncbi:MAG: hypothetical protein ACYCQI_00270 [Gammaproteobacteria bacterium]